VLKGKSMTIENTDLDNEDDTTAELDDDGNPIEKKSEEDELDDDGNPVTKVEEKIADPKIKANLAAAYKARDEALAKLAEIERKEREAETAKLREEGKLAEAHERELADRDTEVAKRDAKIKDLEKELTRLTRDASVRDVLGSYEFRNSKARDMASADITKQLKKNEAGEWVSKDGRSIDDVVKAYLENEDNTFLLKPKQSNGTGLTRTTPNPSTDKQKGSLFGVSQGDVLKMAAEGKLRRK
jgi:hypothetical protein